jgi:hypothetical protein
MKINLITIEQKNSIVEIYNSTPILTLQNKGYEYINKSKLFKDEWKQIETIESILKSAIIGFASFSNFRLDKNNELQIRLQYNYGTEDGDGSFIGVGYILVDELLNGFRK